MSPTLWIGVVLGSLAFAATLLLTLAVEAAFRKRWWLAVRRVLAGTAAAVLLYVALGTLAYALGPARLPAGAEPEQKARALAENIAALMNVSFVGLPLGVVAGAALMFFRARKQAPS